MNRFIRRNTYPYRVDKYSVGWMNPDERDEVTGA
jgi:hypothetical protein